jgi:hypothetical protein
MNFQNSAESNFINKNKSSLKVSGFNKNCVKKIIDAYAKDGIIFSNEKQFQLKFAETPEGLDNFKGRVKLEAESIDKASPYFAEGPMDETAGAISVDKFNYPHSKAKKMWPSSAPSKNTAPIS